jgi:hypothetical protein
MRRGCVAEPADGGDFRPCREIARAGEASLVDEAFGDDIEPRLRCRGATPAGETTIEHQLGHFHRDQHMFFQLHHLNRINARRIVPGEMEMGIDHSRHERGPRAVDDGHAAIARRCATDARRPEA